MVDWNDVRVICIAPNYRKYSLHAVRMMGANIELWTYRLFANDVSVPGGDPSQVRFRRDGYSSR